MYHQERSGCDCALTAQEEALLLNGCDKVGTQCVSITAPMTLAPTAAVGTVTVSCQGNPALTCSTDADGTLCTVDMTQQICVSIPVRYGVILNTTEPTIACSDGGVTASSCCCG